MLDIKFLRENFEKVSKELKKRNFNIPEEFKEQDKKRASLLVKTERLRQQRNENSEKVAILKKEKEDATKFIEETKKISEEIKLLDKELKSVESFIYDLLISIPNITHSSVPVGKDEKDNALVKKVGDIPNFSFTPLNHWDIGENLKILDFERAAKISGARFALYFGKGALLERALINFMLDIHTQKHNYTEVLPPFIVNDKSMMGTGQLPKFEEDLFKIDGTNYYLIPTSEVPITNIHRDEIIEKEKLPIYYTAYTPCFRSEAGSYGKDTRGLIRLHQFNKVELVKFTLPENSYNELELLLENAETILKLLELPYRVITLCTGDTGFSAAKTYDIEVWMPGQKAYREISSCSNFEDFQARRAKIRFKEKGKKGTNFVHTINGSGLAVGRCFAAIIENYQQADGSVIIPKVLIPYVNGLENIHL